MLEIDLANIDTQRIGRMGELELIAGAHGLQLFANPPADGRQPIA